jgi:hypothetical protein
MSKRLDHIIRSVLSEQLRPRYTTKTELLTSAGERFIKTNLCPKIGVNPSKVDTDDDKIYGFYILVKRTGQIPSQGKDPLAQDNGLRDHILSYLDSGLGGVWAANRTTGWYWFLTADLLPVEKDEKSKSDKMFSRYRVLCSYVKSDLIDVVKRANITSATKGHIHTFKQGGLVFEYDSIDSTQWIGVPKKPKIGTTQEAGSVGLPYDVLSFKETGPTAKRIYNYFALGTVFEINIPDDQINYYGCAHREIIKAFQEKSGLPITGNFGTADRDQIIASTDSYKKKKMKDTGETDESKIEMPPYDWSWLTTEAKQKIKDSIKTCQIENREITVDIPVDQIVVPEGGFIAGVTKDDVNFYAVQKLMLAVMDKKGGSDTPQYRTLKAALDKEENRGDFYKKPDGTGATQQIVKMLKNPAVGLGYTDTDPNVVKSDFVDILQKNK